MIDSRKSAGSNSSDKDADVIGHPKPCVVMSSSISPQATVSSTAWPDSEAAGSIPQPDAGSSHACRPHGFGVVERAVAAGARVSMPVQDMFWGGRYGKIVDPFGHEWGINQQVKEQSHEETQIAADEFFRKRQ